MLPNYLANIKSSGIYRFVWDKSEMPTQTAETLRLVIGYSEKGPFNTPVYVTNPDEFKKIFGGRSKKMERYGMWFHRMALQALKAGPILAFNLKNFENPYQESNPKHQAWDASGYNRVDYTTFNPNESIFNLDELGEITENLRMTIKDLYNTDRFWTLEPEHLEDYINEQPKVGYITLTTTDSKETSVTVFMRGYEPKGFDVPFMEWYSSILNGEELPSYLEGHERDLVSQYWAELYIFNGEFTPEVASSDKLAKFFNVNGTEVTLKPYIVNAFGEKIDTLTALAANDASNFVKSYNGILLPDFQNANGTVISLDALVNSENYLHKLMMRFNQDMLYNIGTNPDNEFSLSDIDTTGWNQGPESNIRMMSIDGIEPVVFEANFNNNNWYYNEGIHAGEPADYYHYNGLTPIPANTTVTEDYTLIFEDTQNNQMFGKSGIRQGDSIFIKPQTGDGILTHIVGISSSEEERTVYIFDGVMYNTENEAKAAAESTIEERQYEEYNFTSYGDDQCTIMYSTGKARVISQDPEAGITTVEVIENDTDPTWIGRIFTVNGVTLDPNQAYQLSENGVAIDVWVKCTATTGDSYWTVNGEGEYATEAEAVIAADAMVTSDDIVFTIYDVQFDMEVPDTDIDIYKCVGSVTATSNHLRPLYLKGYTYGNQRPASTTQMNKRDWQDYMLNALTDYRGLRIALTSRVDLEYRYIIDTFESFVGPEIKAKLSTLCKEKDNAFAILNFPQMKNFSKCDFISFRNEKNEFDTKYIPMGGNPLKPMTGVFSLPSQENGASWCGFFTCVKERDINTGVKDDVPSAALVSNNFMKKYSDYLPYTIIAGTNRGVLSDNGLMGPDFNFCREDLDNLEPFGVNCMVYVDRKGTCINSNQTAKQNPVTALSKIHVRELCIFLQDEIERMMLDYHWDFNTPNLRQRIQDRADVILETAKNNGGVYVYRNVCSEQNNTDDVINNEMLVLSTSIEPGMGAGKMVQELTIYRKGGMSSTITEY